MPRSGRRKRASAGQIYSVCSMWNTCPPDVKNKVERTTLADKILTYGSAGVFLGNLAISSSAGTAGTLAADAVLGEAVSLGSRGGLLRPGIPVDTIGPRSLPPARLSAPIVEGAGVEEIPLRVLSTHEISPDTVVTFVDDSTLGPRVELPGEDTSAKVEVPRRDVRSKISRSQYTNPAFNVSIHSNINGAETSATDQVFVSAYAGGHNVGESIPLRLLAPEPTVDDTILEDTDIDLTGTGPRTSTPKKPPVTRPLSGKGSRGPQRTGILKKLLNRNTLQVPIQEEEFLTNPTRLVTFENPAFEPSASLIFERDLEAVQEVPLFEFRDVVHLGRPVITEGPGGRVRVSRLGKKATIKTRSGVRIGSDVHYYRDISSIGHEAVEMQVLGEVSGTAEVADALAASPINDEAPVRDMPVTVTDVYEPEADPSHTLHVNFGSVLDNPGAPISDYILPPRESTVIVDTADGVTVGVPEIHTQPAIIPEDVPEVLIEVYGSNNGDYYLHPSLLRRRKRKRLL